MVLARLKRSSEPGEFIGLVVTNLCRDPSPPIGDFGRNQESVGTCEAKEWWRRESKWIIN